MEQKSSVFEMGHGAAHARPDLARREDSQARRRIYSQRATTRLRQNLWTQPALSWLLLRAVSMFLFQSQLRCPCTALHHLEIALDPIGSKLVWMRTLTASSEHSVFVDRIVELRMIREKDRGTGGSGFCGHVLLRVDVGLEIFDARIRLIVYKIESGAARIRNVHWPAAV